MAKIKPEEELPVVEWIGIASTNKGHTVLIAHTQGERFLDKQMLSDEPETRSLALERARLAFISRMWKVR